MLNFDDERFLRIQRGAVAHTEGLRITIAKLLTEGAANLFFIGSGGAGILMQPAHHLLRTTSTFPAHLVNPAELLANGCPDLGARSIVVIPSLSGTTAETVAALEYVHRRGAVVIALTGHHGTPLADGADHAFVNFAEDDTSCEMFYLQSLAIALAVLEVRSEAPDAGALLAEIAGLPDLLLDAKRSFEPRAGAMAEHLAAADYHVVTGAGTSWPQALYYGMCILEEMQWIRTRPVHASDFFHGTLELVEPGVSVLLLSTEDASRPLCDRVEAFARRYTDGLVVLDPAECELPGGSARLRTLITPVILATLLERVSAHLEVRRDHPLTTRRYYKRVDY